MKRIALFLVLAGFAVALGSLDFGVREAHADAPVWQLTLSSTDAGATQTATIQANTKYSIQCATPACFKTGTGTVAPDCSKDMELPGTSTDKGHNATVNAPAAYSFESGAHTKICAKALDAGNPACDVYQRLQNR